MAGTVAVGMAGAAAAEELPATAAVNAGEHCAVLVDPVEEGAKISKTKELGCFDTFAEAVAAATGGPVKEMGLTPETLTEGQAGPEATLSVDWNNFRYRGASVTYSTSNPFGCFGYFYTFNACFGRTGHRQRRPLQRLPEERQLPRPLPDRRRLAVQAELRHLPAVLEQQL